MCKSMTNLLTQDLNIQIQEGPRKEKRRGMWRCVGGMPGAISRSDEQISTGGERLRYLSHSPPPTPFSLTYYEFRLWVQYLSGRNHEMVFSQH